MTFHFSKSWYGVSLWEQTPRIVRSSRAFTGRINHSSAVWPPPSASGQQRETAGEHPPVAGCIGIHESLTLWLDTPFPSKNKALKVLPAMLDVQLPFPLEDCCWCFIQFSRKTTGTISVLAVAARRAAVQQRLNQYQAVGLDPVIIDHEGLALWQQSLHEKPSRSDATRVVVSLEPDHIAIVIGSGSLFINAHSLQMPVGSSATTALEDTFQRMHRLLCAELQARRTVEWIFCGPLARQPALVNSLHRLLSNEWPGPFIIHKSPETFLPRALSSRALRGGRLRCNLRRQELTHPTILAGRQRRSAHTAILFLLTGILLCAFNLAWQIIGTFHFKDAKREISRLTGELAPGRAITYGREVKEAQEIVQKRLGDFSPVLNIFSQPLSVRLAGIINTGKEARLAYARLEISRDKVTINGTAEDWNYCEHLAGYLRNAGYKVEVERREAEGDNLVHFILRGIVPP
ncbi:MAG: hypothetical protein Q7J98_09240 [Kiritimatiellia bacterium]|nr:hypothetical protein [Kiritimatiellia bacterium]